MDDWESGMRLALGRNIFDSFVRDQTRLIREYNRLAREFGFVTVDARQPIEPIRGERRRHSCTCLARSRSGEHSLTAPPPRIPGHR